MDPPWPYGAWGKASDRTRSNFPDSTPLPFPSMSIKEIKSLPLRDYADKNCELYLWTTGKYLPISFDILKGWGWKYCQTLTWCKRPRGTGQGGIYCPTSEFLILGRRGKMPKVKRVDSTWWQITRTRRHSQKPEFFQDMIETVSEPPRLEIFARRKRPGWDVFGNEVESDIQLFKKKVPQGDVYEH